MEDIQIGSIAIMINFWNEWKQKSVSGQGVNTSENSKQMSVDPNFPQNLNFWLWANVNASNAQLMILQYYWLQILVSLQGEDYYSTWILLLNMLELNFEAL